MRNKWKIPAFLWHTFKSKIQIKRTQGIMKVSFDRDDELTYWTLTFWENEQAMRGFRNHGAHLSAMKKSREIADELEYIHWIGDEAPTWKEAKRRLHGKYNRGVSDNVISQKQPNQ